MDIESHKNIVKRYIEMWNTGNEALADEVLAPGYRDHAHPEVTSVEHVKQALSKTRTAIPDFQITIDQIIGEGELVALRGIIYRTLQGQANISHVLWLARIANGQMTELWTGIETANTQK